MDFSCYIQVTNNLDQPLTLTSRTNSRGEWATAPPATIAAHSVATIHLKDNFGFYGAEGSFAYAAALPLVTETFSTSFGCPTGNNDNYVNNALSVNTLCRINYQARSEEGSWQQNSVPRRGHPLYIDYTFEYQTISTASSVATVWADGDYSVVNAAGTTVDYSQPVWTSSGSYAEGSYSTRPAAFVNKQTGVLTVGLQLDGAMAGVPFRLKGYLSSTLLFESQTVLGTQGGMNVAVASTDPCIAPWQRYGDIRWVMVAQANRQELPLPGATRLELYWLPGSPGKMFPRGTWVTLLRRVLPPVIRDTEPDQIAAHIASYCFAPGDPAVQKTYDSKRGAPHYVTGRNGGFFNIPGYFGRSTEPANCYDQAGVLQTCLGALGVLGIWAFQEPFGYIRTTDLLGRGACNNPFFLATNSPQVIAVNDPRRTMFINHAYIVRTSKVLDACQGPFTGREDIPAYLGASVDTTTVLYERAQQPEMRRPGTANDVTSEAGVTSVEVTGPVADAADHANARFVWRLLTDAAAAAGGSAGGPERFFVGGAAAPFERELTSSGFEVADRREVPGRDGVLLLRTLTGSGVSVHASIWVSSAGTDEAGRRLLAHVAAVELPLSAENTRPVEELGDRAVAIGEDDGHLAWVRHNVQVALIADGEVDLLPVAQAVDEAIRATTVEAGERRFPRLDEPTADAPAVRVGEGVTISVASDSDRLALDLAGSGRLELAAVRGDDHHFRAVEPGEVTVTFVALDAETLTVTAKSVSVSVQGG